MYIGVTFPYIHVCAMSCSSCHIADACIVRNKYTYIDLEDFEGNRAFAVYSPFAVGFNLTVSGYSGTAG